MHCGNSLASSTGLCSANAEGGRAGGPRAKGDDGTVADRSELGWCGRPLGLGNVLLPRMGRRCLSLLTGDDDSESWSNRNELSSEIEGCCSSAGLIVDLPSGSPVMSISSSMVLSWRSCPSMNVFIVDGLATRGCS